MNNQPPPPELTNAATTTRKGHNPRGRNMGEKKTVTSQPKRDQTPAYKPPPPGMEKAKQVGQVKPLATMSINAMKKAGMKPTNHIPKGLQDDIADYAEHEKRESAGPYVTNMFEERLFDIYNSAETQTNLTSYLASMTTQDQITFIREFFDEPDEYVRDIVYNGAYSHVNPPPIELSHIINNEKLLERVRLNKS